MTRSVFLGLVFLLFAVPVAAQQEANADREAVRQAVLDYVEGIYNVSRRELNGVSARTSPSWASIT